MKNILSFLIAKFVALSALLLLGSIIILFSSCNDPDLSELKTDKGDVLFDSRYNDTTTIILKTILEDSLRSDEFTSDVIGSYHDNVIGKVKASVFFEVRLPSTEVNFRIGDVYKSVKLVLKYASNGKYFGDTNEDMTFRVYQLMERIYRDSGYFSIIPVDYSLTEIGQFTGKIQPWDSNGNMEIDLSDDFGNMLFNESSTTYNENEAFLDFIKGFAIVPDDPINKGWIGHFLLEDDSTYLLLNYNDSSSYKFPVNSLAARYGHFQHDFTGSEIGIQLGDQNKIYDRVFIKPQAGVKLRVTLPYIKNYIDSGNIAIHKAELIFKPDDNSPYKEQAPSTLLLLNTNEKNENLTLIDRFEDHYGGHYIDDKEGFSIIITRHLQLLLTSYSNNPDFDEDYGFNLIIPSDNPITSAPLIILQNDLSGNQTTKLKLHYTRP